MVTQGIRTLIQSTACALGVEMCEFVKKICLDLSAPINAHPVTRDAPINCENKLLEWAQANRRLGELEQYVEKCHSETLLDKPTMAGGSVALSIDQLRAPLASIRTAETLTVRPQTMGATYDPLDVISSVALGHCWYFCEPADGSEKNGQTDACEVIEKLMAQFEGQIASNEKMQHFVRQAMDLGLLDGQAQFIDEHYRNCLAGYRLATSFRDRPTDAKSVMHWLLERSSRDDKLQKLRQTVLSYSLAYWPEGCVLLHECGESLIDTNPRRLTVARQLDVLNQALACDTILSTSKWFADDEWRVPIAQRWAEAAGWIGLLPGILDSLFDDPFERLKRQWKRVPIVDRYPYVRAFRLSGRDASELRDLGVAIACSLPDASPNELRKLDRQSPELETWLRLMRERQIEVTKNHLDFLVTILVRRFSQSDRILAKLAREVLTAPHRDLQAVWKSLERHRRSWVKELTDKELDQDNVAELAKSIETNGTDAAVSLLVSRLEERGMRRGQGQSD